MPDAPLETRNERIAPDGDPGRTGEQETERAIAWAVTARARARLAVNSAPLELILNNDFDDELAALRSGRKKYKDFKPVLLHFGEACAKIFEGIGWVDLRVADPSKPPGPDNVTDPLKLEDPTRTKVWDLNRADPSKALEGVADLVEATYAKSTMRFALPDKLKGWLKEKLDIRPPMDLEPAQRDRARAEQNARMDAAVELVVTLLKLWAHFRALSAAEETTEKTEAVKGLIEDLAVIVKSLIVLCRDRIGWTNLKRWSATLRARQDLAQDRSNDLSRRLDGMRGLSEEKKAAMMIERDRERQAEADAARGERNAKPDSLTVAEEVAKVLNGIAGIIEKAGAFSEALRAVWPADLAGDWVIDGLPDPDRAWLLKLEENAASPGAYKGKLNTRGYPAGGENAIGSNPPTTELKADVALVPDAGSRYKLVWIPKALARPALPVQGDACFVNALPVVEALEMRSTRSLEGTALRLGRKPGETGDVHISRASDGSHIVELIVASVELLAAIPEALPTHWQQAINDWFRARFEPWFDALKDRFIPPALQKFGEIEVKGGKLKLGLKRPGVTGTSAGAGVSVTWDLMKLLEWALATPAQRQAMPGPWVPCAIGGYFRFPKFPCDIALELSPFDPAKDKTAGKAGIEDALDKVKYCEWKTDLDAWAKSMGARYDILEPSLDAGEAAKGGLPKMQVPIVIYLEEYTSKATAEKPATTYRWYVKLKLTVGISGEIFATLFPQVRAALFAWQAGWAVGTFLREGVLMRSESYRAAETWVQNSLAGIDPGLDRNTGAITSGTADLFNALLINGWERDLAHAKAELYAWNRMMGREGYPKRFDATSYNRLSETIAERIDYLRTGRSRMRDPNPPRSQFYIHTLAQALLYQHLWGFQGARPADEIEDLLGRAEARGEITPGRKALLLAMLRPDTYTRRCAEIRAAAASPKAPEMLLEEQSMKRVIDAPCYRSAEFARTFSGFRLFIDVINEPWPSGGFKDDLVMVRGEGGAVRWRVTRERANERLAIRFLETSGIDDVLPRAGGGEVFEGWADRHAYEGTFDTLARSLKDYRGRNGKIEVYAKIHDVRADRDLGATRAWTLDVDAAGRVTGFEAQA